MEKHAVAVIGRAWRQHRAYVQRTDQRWVVDTLRGTGRYVTKVYWGDYKDEHGDHAGREFFCSRDPGVPYKFTPRRGSAYLEAVSTGHSKECTRQVLKDPTDRRQRNPYVELRPLPGAPVFKPSPLEGHRALFREASTLVFNDFINEELMIARDAGPDLHEFMTQGGVLPLDAFAGITADVVRLHTMEELGGAVFRDFKPENVCVSDRLSIIDFEDSLLFGVDLPFLRPWHRRGTAIYLTGKLLHGIYEGPVKDRGEHARAAVLYALLMSIIAGTAEADSWLRYEARCFGRHRLEEAGLPLPPGVMHRGNESHFKPWIERHVHDVHRGDVELLLTDPARFAMERRGQANLLQMLRFRAGSEPPAASATALPAARARKRPHSV